MVRRSTTSIERPSSSAASAASRQVAHHRAVCGQGQLRARTDHDRLVEAVRGTGRLVEFRLVPVAALGLEEDHRIIGFDGLLDHPVAVHRFEQATTRRPAVCAKQRLGRLGVVLDRADAAAVGDADDQRHGQQALRARAHLGDLRGDLVEGREDEAVELDLADRPVAAQRQADRRADDAGLGQRAVDDPALAEVILQAVGDPEDAAQLSDVLAHEQDLRVAVHGAAQTLVSAPWRG